ncbi:hypothetical protein VPH35_004773 [Triticum aestivum]
MVSWSEGSSSSSDGYSMTSEAPAPATIFCSEWRGLATDLAARCEHEDVCEKFVSFGSVDSGRRYLACAQKVVRAKAEKDRDEMKQQMDSMKEQMDNMKEELDKVVSQRDDLKKEKKKLEYMIGDFFRHKEETKSKIRRVKEILDEFE